MILSQSGPPLHELPRRSAEFHFAVSQTSSLQKSSALLRLIVPIPAQNRKETLDETQWKSASSPCRLLRGRRGRSCRIDRSARTRRVGRTVSRRKVHG